MDIVSFVAGILLTLITLSLKRFFWLLRIAMCILTSYLILKIWRPYLRLWDITEYTDENFKFLIHSDLLFPSISITLISLAVFYWIIPMILNKWVVKKMEKRIRDFYSSLPPAEIRMVIMKVIRPIICFGCNLVYAFRLEIPKRRMTEEEETITYAEFLESWLISLATVFNAILISPFLLGLGWAFSLLLIVIIFQTLIIIFAPTVIYSKSIINKVVVEFNNKYYKG